jgi:hypothetical protein
MPSTYEPIATQTLGSASSSVTFSSIPSTYTDLILVFNGSSASGTPDLCARFNGDSGTNYSRTFLVGDGTSATSGRSSSQASFVPGGVPNATNSTTVFNIMNYANSTTYKTAICRDTLPANYTAATVGLWRSTAAITSIELFPSANSFITGSTFTLYGIKAA